MSGSSLVPKYLLDANPFIEAKNRYYGFQICPGFWRALIDQHSKGRIISIDHVLDELLAQTDELSEWVKDECPQSFFKKTQDRAVISRFKEMADWVFAQPFDGPAKTEFASVADGWVIAYASVNNLTVVTHEEYKPGAKKKVPMPNVCLQFGVPYVNSFEMLEELGIKLILSTKRRR